MTAKEMFEKLGYEQEEMYNCIYYNKGQKCIEIWLNAKEIQCNEYIKEDEHYIPADITFEELQAINKQVEELGWLGDKE